MYVTGSTRLSMAATTDAWRTEVDEIVGSEIADWMINTQPRQQASAASHYNVFKRAAKAVGIPIGRAALNIGVPRPSLLARSIALLVEQDP